MSCGGKAAPVLGELFLRCVRRDSFSRNLSEDVSARSGTVTSYNAPYNAPYGVLPSFPTFFACLLILRTEIPETRRPTPHPAKNPETVVVDVCFAGRFPGFNLFGWYHERGLGRSRSFDPLYPYKGTYPGWWLAVAVVLGRGKLEKIEVHRTKWEQYQVKLRGEQLRKQGACRGLDIRAANFVSRLSGFQASEFQREDRMLRWIEELLAGERARKLKPANTVRERLGGGNWREGNSPLWRRGGPHGG